MLKFLKNILFGLIVIIYLFGCEEIGEYYVGLDQQPKFIDGKPITGLNIFGMLLPGYTFGISNSFIELHFILPVTDTLSDLEIKNANIYIVDNENNTKWDYTYCNPDSIFQFEKYRNIDFQPVPGKEYEIYCKYDTFTTLTAKTVIPYIPEIDTIIPTQKEKKITLKTDTIAFIYDIFYYSSQMSDYQRIVKEAGIPVSFEIPNSEEQIEIEIFAYDKNYMNYLTQSNTFFKPNAFRPSFSVVENGYGCFASMNFLRFTINKNETSMKKLPGLPTLAGFLTK